MGCCHVFVVYQDEMVVEEESHEDAGNCSSSLWDGATTAQSKEQQCVLNWSSRMSSCGQNTRDEANQLVLEYLMVSGFREAAEEFAQEAGLKIDVGSMADREEARNLILSGDILGCIRLLDNMDKNILENDPSLFFDLLRQQFVELLLLGGEGGGGTAALKFAQERLLPQVLRDPGLLRSVERLMGLVAFATPSVLQLMLSASPSSSTFSSPSLSSSTATAAAKPLPPQVSFLQEALDGQRRMDLATRVNNAMLTSGGLSCQPELPGVLRHVKHLQQQLLLREGDATVSRVPIITNISAAE
jgi:hypothetical protein